MQPRPCGPRGIVGAVPSERTLRRKQEREWGAVRRARREQAGRGGAAAAPAEVGLSVCVCVCFWEGAAQSTAWMYNIYIYIFCIGYNTYITLVRQ